MKTAFKLTSTVILIGLFASLSSFAETTTPDLTKADQQRRLKWWKEARFGMFVHWGLYSGLAGNWDGKKVKKGGGMEWIQNHVKADTDTYAKAAIPLFKPSKDFAEEWAKVAADAGCKYIVFTTKHHEGFCLHDSKVSDYDAGSVLNRDLVKEIVKAAHAHGLRVGFYHSVIDWHHDQYEYNRSKGLPHPLRGKPYPNGKRDQKKYIKYLHAQVKELVTNYGPVDILWWDYSKEDFQGEEAWGASNLIKMVRTAQPNIIMNNRLYRSPEAGWLTKKQRKAGIQPTLDPKYGDFSTPEQHIPPNGIPGMAWETCMTMNGTWGYSEYDHRWKSTKKLIQNLVDIVSKGGNYLLNVGPKGDGSIPQESIKRLHEMGLWLKVNGEAIYGTQPSPFKEKLTFGRATQKGDKIYLHVFDWPKDQTLTVPLQKKVVRAYLLADPKSDLKITKTAKGITLKVPAEAPDANVSVIALECADKK